MSEMSTTTEVLTEEGVTEELSAENKVSVGADNEADTFESAKKSTGGSKQGKSEKKSQEDARTRRFREENLRLDRYYDGYYDDVLPTDDGETKRGIDKEVAKKIAGIVAVGAVLIAIGIFIFFKA